VVITGEPDMKQVLEMWQRFPNQWSASTWLIPGQYNCRFYTGNQRNIVHYGPATINGVTDYGLDRAFRVEVNRAELPRSSLKILLVQDHLDTLTAYAKLLRRDGYVVFAADGYQAAVNVARQEQIDLAICDIGLWDGDGCKLLKELQKLQPVKAIAVTGLMLENEVVQYRDAGFDAVFPKPLDLSRISDAIAELSHFGQP
jgi:CheY-like chemotaxis protein